MPKKNTTLPPELGFRLKKLRIEMGLSQVQLAKLAGVSQSTISSAEKGEHAPPLEVYHLLACKFPEVDLRALLCDKNTELSVDASSVAAQIRPVIRVTSLVSKDLPPENAADDYMAVPLLEGKVAAGPGGVIWEKVKSLVWVYRPELGHHKNLVAVTVAGDSMIPTIPPGAISIIDRDQWQTTGSRKHIWAIRTEDGDTQIKRLHKVNGGLLILSDNFAEHPPTPSWTGDLKKLIIGKVIWMWRSL